jgi:hypothetical protein
MKDSILTKPARNVGKSTNEVCLTCRDDFKILRTSPADFLGAQHLCASI